MLVITALQSKFHLPLWRKRTRNPPVACGLRAFFDRLLVVAVLYPIAYAGEAFTALTGNRSHRKTFQKLASLTNQAPTCIVK